MYEELIKNLRIHFGFCIGYPHYCDSCTESESVCDVSLAGQSADAIEVLSEERKPGKWIFSYDHGGPNRAYFCSECKITIHAANLDAWSFCPNCGAKMIGGDDDV